MRAAGPRVRAVAVFGADYRYPRATGDPVRRRRRAGRKKEGGPGEGFGATLYQPARGTPTRIQRQAHGSDRGKGPKFNMLHCRIALLLRKPIGPQVAQVRRRPQRRAYIRDEQAAVVSQIVPLL